MMMTNESEEAGTKPTTQEIPLVPPPQSDWRQQPVTWQPVDDTATIDAIEASSMPAGDPTVAGEQPVKRHRGTRYRLLSDGMVLATHFKRRKKVPDRWLFTIMHPDLVDTSLLHLVRSMPMNEGENEIRYLQRRHWWALGSHLIGAAMLAALFVVSLVFYFTYEVERTIGQIGTFIFLAWLVVVIVDTSFEWSRWYYKAILVTNQRLILVRGFPIGRYEQPDIWLTALDDISMKPLPFGFRYGKLTGAIRSGDTESSEWFTKRGLNYLNDYEYLEGLLRP